MARRGWQDGLGVCAWSLRAPSVRALVEQLARLGVRCVQVSLDPLRTREWDAEELLACARGAGIRLASGMMAMEGEDYSTLGSIARTGGVRPDATWPANERAAIENARVARRLGLGLVTFHAGFLPHAGGGERARIVERVARLAGIFAGEGVRVGLETGQEDAGTLMGVLDAVDARAGAGVRVGVNLDPGNMILYGMGDPVAALEVLGGRVVQAHIKDALASAARGEWGREVVAGTGQVDWARFLDGLERLAPGVDLLVEREAGEDREGDIAAGLAMLRRWGDARERGG